MVEGGEMSDRLKGTAKERMCVAASLIGFFIALPVGVVIFLCLLEWWMMWVKFLYNITGLG